VAKIEERSSLMEDFRDKRFFPISTRKMRHYRAQRLLKIMLDHRNPVELFWRKTRVADRDVAVIKPPKEGVSLDATVEAPKEGCALHRDGSMRCKIRQ